MLLLLLLFLLLPLPATLRIRQYIIQLHLTVLHSSNIRTIRTIVRIRILVRRSLSGLLSGFALAPPSLLRLPSLGTVASAVASALGQRLLLLRQ